MKKRILITLAVLAATGAVAGVGAAVVASNPPTAPTPVEQAASWAS